MRRAERSWTTAAVAALSLVFFPALPGSAFAPGGSGGPAPSLVRQALGYVERLYVEPARVDPAAMLEGALQSLERAYPAVIVERPGAAARAVVSVNGARRTFDLSGAATIPGAAAALEQVLAFLAEREGSLGAPAAEAPYAALRGALATLDPHTQAFSPAQVKDFQTQTRGTFGGVGFVFSVVPDGILVGEILPGTPAERAGLLPGDLIATVDGVPIAGFTSADVTELVRGDPGTSVVLGLARAAGREPRVVTAVRAVVSGRSVRSAVLRGEGLAPVLHATVERFQSDTAAQLQAALDEAPEDAAGVVLDLRGNPGGLLDQAVAVADIFLDEGVIVETRERTRPPKVFRAGGFGVVRRQLPLVVLINRGSASASEVVAAALRPARALLVGERSFGKGSVQQIYPLTDGGGLLLTIRHYLTPDEVSIQARGVEPDLLLEPVVVGERVVLGAPAVHAREAQLKNAFATGDGAAAPEPLWRVAYLREQIPAPGTPAAAQTGHDDPARDAALRIAASLLREAAAGGVRAGRAALLAAAGPVAGRASFEEESRIVAAFAARGIDWSAGPEGAPVRALAVEPVGPVLLEGGTAALTVRVSNPGPLPAHRVWGVSSSSQPLLSGLVFAFGALAPGQAREVTVPVPVPAWSWPRWDPWSVTLSGGGLGSAQGTARTAAGTQPSLAFSVSLSDANDADPGRSGDGVLSGGERLTVLIRPVGGAGDPDSLQVRLASGSGGSLRLGRRERTLGFAAGAAAEFDGVVADEPGAGPLRIAVSFSGRSFGKVIEDLIEIPLGAPYAADAERRPPMLRLIEPVPERTRGKRMTLKIAVTDETSVKDIYVLLGDRKIFYRRPAPGGASLPLEVLVPLEEGSNRIEVVARDGDDLLARRSFFVYRTPASAPG